MKPSQTPGDDGELADLLGELHDRGQHILRRRIAAHDFQQAHDIGGAEEVQSHDIRRAAGELRDLVDIESRGVGGQDRAGFGNRVELAEHLFLDTHFLEHGLDDEIRVRRSL